MERIGRAICLLLSLILFSGCSCKDVPKRRSIGRLSASKSDATIEATVVSPSKPSDFTLVSHDGRGGSRPFCNPPNWPLVLDVRVLEEATGRRVIDQRVGGQKMQFTSWHVPATSVVLELGGWLPDTMKEGQSYRVEIAVAEPAPELGELEVFFHWIGR